MWIAHSLYINVVMSELGYFDGGNSYNNIFDLSNRRYDEIGWCECAVKYTKHSRSNYPIVAAYSLSWALFDSPSYLHCPGFHKPNKPNRDRYPPLVHRYTDPAKFRSLRVIKNYWTASTVIANRDWCLHVFHNEEIFADARIVWAKTTKLM